MEKDNFDLNEEELMRQIMLLEAVAKKSMSKEAISRYGNLKIAHPETAIKVITIIAQATQLGQISKPVNDDEFKTLLIEIQRGKKQFNFRK